MNEQSRQRLGRIAKRHASRMAREQGEGEGDEAFLAEFVRVRGEVLRPVMEEIGAQLREEGYEFRVVDAGSEKLPAVELRVVLPRREDSKDTIRFVAHEDTVRGWQVIAEIELTRSPIELTRFDAGDPITREIAEHVIVDATEQIFASALAAPAASAREKGATAAPASPAPPRAAKAKAPAAEAGAPAEAAEGVRALVLGRLRDGRVLHGLDLVGADLHGIDFTGALMPGLDLRRANLRGCLLAGANLVAARLNNADLTDAVLGGANLSRANLSQAILAGARFDDAVLVDTIGAPRPAPPPHEVRAHEVKPTGADVAAAADLPLSAGGDPAPQPPPRAPGRISVESLPAAKLPAPVVMAGQPTFLASQPAPLAATSLAFDLPVGAVLPFAKSVGDKPPPATAPAVAPATARRDPALPTGTSLAFELPRGPATPFQTEPAAPGANAPSAPAPKAAVGTSTAWAPSEPSGPATPFQALEPEALGFDLMRYAEFVATRGEQVANRAKVLARFGIDAAAEAQVEAYWRRRLDQNGLLALEFGNMVLAAQRAAKERRARAATAPPEAGGATAPTGQSTPAPPTTDQATFPTLSVEQYAWLVATLRKATTAELPTLLPRLRLTPETRRDLEEHWSKRMASDPALRERFIAALNQHLAGANR